MSDMEVLASFVFKVKGIMFYKYGVCGASMGERVRLVRRPYDRHDVNCVDVVLERGPRTLHKIGHVEAEVSVHLSPLLRDAPVEASG